MPDRTGDELIELYEYMRHEASHIENRDARTQYILDGLDHFSFKELKFIALYATNRNSKGESDRMDIRKSQIFTSAIEKYKEVKRQALEIEDETARLGFLLFEMEKFSLMELRIIGAACSTTLASL